jgi:GNAT superfamily N-acetyltransferase
LEIKELTISTEMVAQIELIQYLYPKMTIQKYEDFLQEMVPFKYKQVAVFENGNCIGLTGYWFGTKLWTGKYIEIDNFIVHPDHRKKGVGQLITNYINKKAIELDCTCIVLDAFTGNFPAHRFYYNQGYEPRGFHFLKLLDPEKLT